jgi:hypothetical protein
MTIPPDMQAELETFDKACDAAIAEFVQELEAKHPPAMLYHYTDDGGLKGILESGTIRLTNVANLNDPAELKHGFSHAVEIINRRAALQLALKALRLQTQGPPEGKRQGWRRVRLLSYHARDQAGFS